MAGGSLNRRAGGRWALERSPPRPHLNLTWSTTNARCGVRLRQPRGNLARLRALLQHELQGGVPMILNNIHTRATLAAGLLAGCIVLLVPGLTKAQAADLATAAPGAANAPAAVAQPRPGYIVFFEPSGTEVSPAAADTIRIAARKARANKAPLVRVVGRADYAEAVKAELVRQGVQPTSIVLVGRDDNS